MGVQLDGKTPAVASWNFSIEQQLVRNISLRVAYVGSHGYHNIIDVDANTIPQQICSNPAGWASGSIRATNPPTLVPQGTPYPPDSHNSLPSRRRIGRSVLALLYRSR
jgi:hypothetical protein